MITSLGYHTFTIFLRLTFSQALSLYRDFQKCKDVRIRPIGKDKRNPAALPKGYVVEYIGKNKGIKWYVRFYSEMADFMDMSLNPNSPNYLQIPKEYSVKVTINPKVFVGIRDYLAAANSDCLERVEYLFNIEAARISPILRKFEYYSLNRIDYCLNCDLEELGIGCSPKQMMCLIKRSNIPKHFTEWTEYSKISHRHETNQNALYLKNNSVAINFYQKYEQLLNEFPACPDLEDSLNLIRCEIQCKYPKVYSMSRIIKYNLRSTMPLDELLDDIMNGRVNPIKEMLSDYVANRIISKYFDKVIRKGDYLTLAGARWMIEAHNFRRDKKERLIWALELINESRGIAKAKSKVSSVDLNYFKRSLDDLDDILVNPVTIPREWGIEHIPNLLRAYYDSIVEERLISKNERIFEKLLAKYLA